jgi:hypothetical protein
MILNLPKYHYAANLSPDVQAMGKEGVASFVVWNSLVSIVFQFSPPSLFGTLWC